MLRTRLLILATIVVVPHVAWPQGNPLGPEFRVNSYTAGHQDFPSAAADAAGRFVVVWNSYGQDGSLSGLFGQRYDSSGAPLGQEFRVNTYTTGQQGGGAAVAADAAGNFVVVWNSDGQDGSSFGVFGQRYDSSGAPLGPEFRVNTTTAGAQATGAVASDLSGNFVVVWSNLGFAIFGQRYAFGGSPLGSEFRVNAFTTGCPHSPDVAVDGSGNFVVAWQDKIRAGGMCPFPTEGILARRFAASGAPLGTDFRVNASTAGYQSQVTVAADAAGDIVIAWFSTLSAPAGIHAQRYDSAGAAAGPEFQVNSFPSVASGPDVAMDAPGNFVVVWYAATQDGSGYGVFGQRYDNTGVPSGTDFRVNSYTTGAQTSPAVAAEPTGRFVVTWQSDGQDGSGHGVFAQRYGPIFPVELMHFRVE
jgi:hypothetical protein